MVPIGYATSPLPACRQWHTTVTFITTVTIHRTSLAIALDVASILTVQQRTEPEPQIIKNGDSDFVSADKDLDAE